MSAVAIDVGLLADIKRYRAADVSACFSCGVCTATCPLVDDATFPRRLIRWAQVGMRDQLLGSKELWACYHCGECSDNCPTGADPAGFMAAARRWAIGSYDRTRVARTLYTHPLLGTLFALLLAAFFAVFMYTSHGPQDRSSLALFEFIPAELIHTTGTAVMAVVFLAGLVGVATMIGYVARAEGLAWSDVLGGGSALRRSARALWWSFGLESHLQRRSECEGGPAEEDEIPLPRRRRILHLVTMWGFLGLLAATLLDYGLALLGIKTTGTPVPIWYPVRLLGTMAGIALVYGSTMLIVDRIRKTSRATADSVASDWMLLALIWTTGVSGFLIEIALYLPQPPVWGYWVFLFHVAVAMELVLLAPFMKLAHAIYRPIALFFLALAASRTRTEPVNT